MSISGYRADVYEAVIRVEAVLEQSRVSASQHNGTHRQYLVFGRYVSLDRMGSCLVYEDQPRPSNRERLTLKSMQLVLDSDGLASILQVLEILMQLFCNFHQGSHDLGIVSLVAKCPLDAHTLALLSFTGRNRIVRDAQVSLTATFSQTRVDRLTRDRGNQTNDPSRAARRVWRRYRRMSRYHLAMELDKPTHLYT